MDVSNIPQHTIYRMANAEYLGKRIFNVVSNHVDGEDSVTYGQFETQMLAKEWIQDTWGEDHNAHIETSLIVTLRLEK